MTPNNHSRSGSGLLFNSFQRLICPHANQVHHRSRRPNMPLPHAKLNTTCKAGRASSDSARTINCSGSNAVAPKRTHTHTHSHARTQTQTQTHRHTDTQTHRHTHPHTHTPVRAHALPQLAIGQEICRCHPPVRVQKRLHKQEGRRQRPTLNVSMRIRQFP